MIGPLLAALVLARRHSYHAAFACMLVPAAVTVLLVSSVRLRYPSAGRIAVPIDARTTDGSGAGILVSGRLPRAFWLYAAGAARVGFGFADYSLISYHFAVARTVPASSVPVLYALATAAGGTGSLAAGRWYDRRGLTVLIPSTLLIAAYAPLVFLGRFWSALIGTVLWGVGVGIHETVMSAAVAHMVPAHRRARAYGIFTAIFGFAWFAGSATLGAFYDYSLSATVLVAALTQLLALLPIGLAVKALHAQASGS